MSTAPRVLLVVLFMASAVQAVPPELPEGLTYQGVLLDDQGQPRTGNVALTLRLYDAVFGGALVYKQEFAVVPLVDGVFTVVLGPVGAATDTPTDPLTTDLSDALAGDVGATGPSRFLEVTVGSDGPLTRTQVLAVPYALRAAEADSAASAGGVAGFPSSVFQQIVENSNLDATGPLNSDPTEGFGDTDNDGLANFVDPDNDNDTLDDGTEIAQGSDINLVTPVLTGVSPPSGFSPLTQTVTLTGHNFDPATSVVFGSESPPPTNLSPTSLDVLVGPQPPGSVDIQLTLPNGQQTLVASAFEFLSSVVHSVAFPTDSRLGLSVRDQATLVVTGRSEYQLPLDAQASSPLPFVTKHTFGEIDVALSPADVLTGIRCRQKGTFECDVEIAVDDDGDRELEDETGIFVVGLDFDASTRIDEATLDFDSSGNVAAGFFFANLFRAVAVVHDRNGDSVITQAANEYVVIDLQVGSFPLVDFALDASDRAAALYWDVADGLIYAAWDRSGDGDFDDTPSGTPEIVAVATSSAVQCLGLGFAPDGDLVAVYGSSEDGTVFLRDLDQDGDVDGAGEVATLDATPAGICDLEGDAGQPVAVFHNLNARLNLLVDRDDDGGFGGVDEVVDLGSAAGLSDAALDENANGVAFLATVYSDATPDAILVDPIP